MGGADQKFLAGLYQHGTYDHIFVRYKITYGVLKWATSSARGRVGLSG
jgi:hypothetical protein